MNGESEEGKFAVIIGDQPPAFYETLAEAHAAFLEASAEAKGKYKVKMERCPSED